MNREILFRAKRVDNHLWIKGNFVSYTDYDGRQENLIYATNGNPNNILVETLCEYTGLTDKNGKQIFEDDIVSIGELSAVKVCGCYVVKYNTKQARYGLFTADGAEQAGFNFDTMKSYNIIGNIYDNPELLKAEQQ